MYRHLLSSLLAVASEGHCGEVWQQCHSCQLSFNTLKFLFILVMASKLLKYLSNCSLYIYYKNRLQLIATSFYQFLNNLKKRQPATATGFESGQLQPMVWLQLVAFGPVSVIFLVLATGPLNTTYFHPPWHVSTHTHRFWLPETPHEAQWWPTQTSQSPTMASKGPQSLMTANDGWKLSG